MIRSVVWGSERLKFTEHAALSENFSNFTLQGVVIGSSSDVPMRFDYHVSTDEHWRTTGASVTVIRGNDVQDFVFVPDAAQNWLVNGEDVAAYKGCIDIDLGFSPVTNTLPIRRLDLEVGQSADVEAAWLRYPELDFVKLPQRYTRQSEHIYTYESFLNGFTAQLEVDEYGFVKSYEGLWHRLATS
jgi:hypothetical protein